MAAKRQIEKFTRYDAADYLKSAADMAAYLEAVMEDGGNLAMALGAIARARGMVRLAKDTGLTREGLYKALSPEGNPSFDTVLKVAAALGLELVPRPAAPAAEEVRPTRSARRTVAA